MYSVMSYGYMASDGVRMDAYARAIAEGVRPGSVVLDLGAGTGIMSLLAARAGARKVYAVDTNPAVLLLHELAKENGLEDRIEIHNMSSLELELSEKADVIISDLRGSTVLNDESLTLIHDARERLLRPGGTLIPAEDRLMVTVVESSRLARDFDHATVGFTRLGLSSDAARASMMNTVFPDRTGAIWASDVLSTSGRWATIDYATVEPEAFDGTVELSVERGGRANALAIWFESILLEGLTYKTAPGYSTVYTQILLPLLEPLDVSAADRFVVTVRANARGQSWAWDTTLIGADGVEKKRFRQATFLGLPTSPAMLLRASTTFKPSRSAFGERVARILASMDGEHAVGEIADLVAGATSLRRNAVLEEVRDIVERYGR